MSHFNIRRGEIIQEVRHTVKKHIFMNQQGGRGKSPVAGAAMLLLSYSEFPDGERDIKSLDFLPEEMGHFQSCCQYSSAVEDEHT